MTMRKYTKAQATEILRVQVGKKSAAEMGRALDVTGAFVTMVLSGQRIISDDVTIRLLELLYGHGRWTFVKLPDVFTRIAKKGV